MSLLAALLLLQTDLQHAQSLLRDGKVAEAQVAIEAVLKESPRSVDALTVQGRVAMAQSNFDLARTSFQHAAELAPRSAGVQFLLGFFHYVDNDFVQAQPVLERARKLDPSNARTALFLALTYEGLARPAEAESLFKETLRLEQSAKQPGSEAQVAYARMLFSQGRFDEAKTQVAAALQKEPNSREALYEHARIDFEQGRFADCILRAEQALPASGEGVTDRQIHFLLSRAYGRVGDAARAGEHRRQFEAIPPRLIR